MPRCIGHDRSLLLPSTSSPPPHLLSLDLCLDCVLISSASDPYRWDTLGAFVRANCEIPLTKQFLSFARFSPGSRRIAEDHRAFHRGIRSMICIDAQRQLGNTVATPKKPHGETTGSINDVSEQSVRGSTRMHPFSGRTLLVERSLPPSPRERDGQINRCGFTAVNLDACCTDVVIPPLFRVNCACDYARATMETRAKMVGGGGRGGRGEEEGCDR